MAGRVRYVAARLIGAAASLAGVVVVGFFLFRMLPGDPVRAITHGRPVDAAQLARLRERLGTDQPTAVQFWRYLRGLLHGDMGTSYQYDMPVSALIGSRFSATVYLVGTATVISAWLGGWLGARSGWRPGSLGDRINTGLALVLWSVPTFWLGLVLIVALSVGIGPLPGLFPTGGINSPGVHGTVPVLLDQLHHLVLPCATLVAVLYAQYLLIVRACVRDETSGDYVRTARAKGLRDAVVRRRHVLPNALLPVVTLVFVNLGGVVSGAILVESVFSWPGLGSLFYEALTVPELPLLHGLFVVFSASVILLNLLADLVYPVLDPRVRPT